MQNWEINPDTGDYVMEGGAPKQTNSLRVPAYIRLKTPRGGWMYAPNETYGSEFRSIQKRLSTVNSSNVEGAAARALMPLANDGRASEIDISLNGTSRHGVGLNVTLRDQRGQIEQLQLSSLGV